MKTNIKPLLPMGASNLPVTFPHFPTRHQALVWRNWGLVPIERLANVLRCLPHEVLKAGLELGLREADALADPLWGERGYMTLIRRNWHLLAYEQLLELLDWSEEQLYDALKEDDFLWHKMGFQKPSCETVVLQQLTELQIAQTRTLREVVNRHLLFDLQGPGEEPFAFLGRTNRAPVGAREVPFELRLAYPSNALYGDPLLDSSGRSCQDEELEAMASWGINAIWFQAILYKLFPWNRAMQLSEGWEERLEGLRRLIHRASQHGIKVFLYLNEPRCLPTQFFDEHPDLKGLDLEADGCSAMCTSVNEVRSFLRKACTHVFEQAPGLGGAFTITMSENLTNCYSKGIGAAWGRHCARCEARDIAEVVAEVNCEIEAGIHAANADARVITWTWGWRADWAARAVAKLPENVDVLCVSELGIPVKVGGVPEVLNEYYIAHPGPGPTARMVWAKARERGLKTIAKIQINSTWECAAVPYIPAVDLVEKHLRGLQQEGVDGVMLSWTLGAYLGGNLGLLGSSAKEMAERIGGVEAAPEIERAWTLFGQALAEFPSSNQVLYMAPQTFGPANLLFENPSGYKATMLGFCYDDLKGWRAQYSEEVFQTQFEKLASKWNDGVLALEAIQTSGTASSPQFFELVRISTAIYCHYRSVALQVAFVRERDRTAGPRSAEMKRILDEEISVARRLLFLVHKDSHIGYEPTCHYFYTANDLMEKIVNCEFLKTRFCPEGPRA